MVLRPRCLRYPYLRMDASRMVDVSTLVSVAGALGIGSIFGQFVSAGKDRRAARAAVLQAINEVEEARWSPVKEGAPTFKKSMHGLYTSALIAQIPRGPLRLYMLLAQAAQWESADSWDSSDDSEFGGGISSKLADIVRDSARVLIAAVWAPRGLRKVRTLSMVRGLDRKISKIDDQNMHNQIRRATSYIL